jgi:hypothetical protein
VPDTCQMQACHGPRCRPDATAQPGSARRSRPRSGDPVRDLAIPVVGRVLVDQRRPDARVPHPSHQLTCTGPRRGGDGVPGVAQVVEVDRRYAGVEQCIDPDSTEVPPTKGRPRRRSSHSGPIDYPTLAGRHLESDRRVGARRRQSRGCRPSPYMTRIEWLDSVSPCCLRFRLRSSIVDGIRAGP